MKLTTRNLILKEFGKTILLKEVDYHKNIYGDIERCALLVESGTQDAKQLKAKFGLYMEAIDCDNILY